MPESAVGADASAANRPSLYLPAAASDSTVLRHTVLSNHGSTGVARSCPSGKTDDWGNCPAADRKRVTIRASAHDRDDVSAELERGMREANNGGLLALERGKLYVVGKKLDLAWLRDVYVQLEGEIRVSYAR